MSMSMSMYMYMYVYVYTYIYIFVDRKILCIRLSTTHGSAPYEIYYPKPCPQEPFWGIFGEKRRDVCFSPWLETKCCIVHAGHAPRLLTLTLPIMSRTPRLYINKTRKYNHLYIALILK